MDKHKYKIIDIYNFTDHTYKLSCERNNFEFISGQCVNIGLVGSVMSYTTTAAGSCRVAMT